MESGEIKDKQISATKDEGNVDKARLNRGEYWSAGSGSKVSDLGRIQVDLREITIVTRMATQVEEVNGEYSIDFRVEYSTDDNTWEAILQSENGTNKVSVLHQIVGFAPVCYLLFCDQCYLCYLNGSQLAKMKKSIPDMSLPLNL